MEYLTKYDMVHILEQLDFKSILYLSHTSSKIRSLVRQTCIYSTKQITIKMIRETVESMDKNLYFFETLSDFLEEFVAYQVYKKHYFDKLMSRLSSADIRSVINEYNFPPYVPTPLEIINVIEKDDVYKTAVAYENKLLLKSIRDYTSNIEKIYSSYETTLQLWSCVENNYYRFSAQLFNSSMITPQQITYLHKKLDWLKNISS
jgi:hypothetical protein